jgi:hypothetical protein
MLIPAPSLPGSVDLNGGVARERAKAGRGAMTGPVARWIAFPLIRQHAFTTRPSLHVAQRLYRGLKLTPSAAVIKAFLGEEGQYLPA